MIVTVKGWLALAFLSGAALAAMLGLSWTAALCGSVVGFLAGVRP